MFIESSRPRVPGDVARLLTPIYPTTNGKCLTFYYHMYGAGTGTLNVKMKQQGQLTPPIWTRKGNQDNKWRIAQVNIVTPSPYQVSYIKKITQVNIVTTSPYQVSYICYAFAIPGWLHKSAL